METWALWQSENPELVGDVCLVVDEDVEDFLAVSADLVPAPRRAYRLKNTDVASRSWIAGAVCWLAQRGAPARMVGVGDWCAASFFHCLEHALSAVKSWNPRTYRSPGVWLGDATFPCFHAAVDLIDDYMREIVEPVRNIAFFGARSGSWFGDTRQFVSGIDRFVAAADKRTRDLVHVVRPLVEAAGQVKGDIVRFSGGSTHSVASRLAAYCCRLAQLSYEVGENTTGYLFAHRSIDLFLLSLGISNGTASITNRGPRLVGTAAFERPDVYVLNSYDELCRAGVLQFKLERKRKLKSINEIRNALLPTHGTFSCSRGDLVDCLRWTRRFTEEALGNKSWVTLEQKLLAPPAIDLASFVRILPGLETYFDQIPLT